MAPGENCVCGFYATSSPLRFFGQGAAGYQAWLGRGRALLGEVHVWGKVIPHEHGARVQFARIHRLYDMGVEQRGRNVVQTAGEKLKVPVVKWASIEDQWKKPSAMSMEI